MGDCVGDILINALVYSGAMLLLYTSIILIIIKIFSLKEKKSNLSKGIIITFFTYLIVSSISTFINVIFNYRLSSDMIFLTEVINLPFAILLLILIIVHLFRNNNLTNAHNKVILITFTISIIFIIYLGLLVEGIIPSFDSCNGSLLDYMLPLILSAIPTFFIMRR